jgi:hypothetical protein
MQEMRCTVFMEIARKGEKPEMFNGDVSGHVGM